MQKKNLTLKFNFVADSLHQMKGVEFIHDHRQTFLSILYTVQVDVLNEEFLGRRERKESHYHTRSGSKRDCSKLLSTVSVIRGSAASEVRCAAYNKIVTRIARACKNIFFIAFQEASAY